MIFPSNRVRIMVATKAIDFRKGHDSLAAMVKNELRKDPFTRAALRNLTRAFPGFAKARVLREWSGVMDATPDAIPVISPVHTRPGFYLASGFSGHGFGIGPGAGQLMADLITSDTPSVDPAVFDIARLRPKYGRAAAGSSVRHADQKAGWDTGAIDQKTVLRP